MIRSDKTETLQEPVVALETERLHEIILFNDEVNTFDWVIESLVQVCEHSAEQAEQCSIIVHYKGKCSVKSGSFDELKPRCSNLLERGLSAEIA